jgi:hypothetical protein
LYESKDRTNLLRSAHRDVYFKFNGDRVILDKMTLGKLARATNVVSAWDVVAKAMSRKKPPPHNLRSPSHTLANRSDQPLSPLPALTKSASMPDMAASGQAQKRRGTNRERTRSPQPQPQALPQQQTDVSSNAAGTFWKR